MHSYWPASLHCTPPSRALICNRTDTVYMYCSSPLPLPDALPPLDALPSPDALSPKGVIPDALPDPLLLVAMPLPLPDALISMGVALLLTLPSEFVEPRIAVMFVAFVPSSMISEDIPPA